MTTALFVHCSPLGRDSQGYQLGKQLLASNLPANWVRERDLTADPLPPIGGAYATAITARQGQEAALAQSERLIGELEGSAALVISTPMHNFTVPASLKLWIDHVLRINRSFSSTQAGKVGLLKDRPTLVLVSSGGFHLGERALQPDFLTPYLRHALRTMGIKQVDFVYLQGMAHGAAAVEQALDAARLALEKLVLPFATALKKPDSAQP